MTQNPSKKAKWFFQFIGRAAVWLATRVCRGVEGRLSLRAQHPAARSIWRTDARPPSIAHLYRSRPAAPIPRVPRHRHRHPRCWRRWWCSRHPRRRQHCCYPTSLGTAARTPAAPGRNLGCSSRQGGSCRRPCASCPGPPPPLMRLPVPSAAPSTPSRRRRTLSWCAIRGGVMGCGVNLQMPRSELVAADAVGPMRTSARGQPPARRLLRWRGLGHGRPPDTRGYGGGGARRRWGL